MTDEFYKESRNKSRNKTDRYKNCPILEDEDTGDILISTREDEEIFKRSTDIYHRVQPHESRRLDILAHIYYKNPLLWWVIAQANNIYDPFYYVEPGTLLRVPSIETLYGNNGILL